MHRLLVLLALCVSLFLAALSLACGGSSSPDVTIEVKAQNTRFAPETIEVPAGKTVRLKLTNLDSTEHDLEVRGMTPSMMSGGGHGGHGDSMPGKLAVHTAAKKSASVDFRADQKGTYEVFCTIPGHEQSGMVARLVVT